MQIVWHRFDLRTHDNPALFFAAEKSKKVLPVFIYDKNSKKQMGGASLWWLHHSLKDLSERYKELGTHLVILEGNPGEELAKLAKKTKAEKVFYNRAFQPPYLEEEKAVCAFLQKEGIEVEGFNGNYLIDPEEILNKSNNPYSVFTPFKKCVLELLEMYEPLKEPKHLESVSCKGEPLSSLHFIPKISWYKEMEAFWEIGRKGAEKSLQHFIKTALSDYSVGRNIPSEEGTSFLSPHLHFGEISPREVLHAIQSKRGESVETFASEIVWREFANYFLFHFPKTVKENWDKKFDHFPWKNSSSFLKKWQKGQTGYPLVDAGMRQLWKLGWMHNRVRMVVASFLIKHLLIDWREGEKWFFDTLVDADVGSNIMNWQWVAGSGPDAAPYFRIFNPILQSEKFDPEGHYIRQFVPELKLLSNKWIHTPWLAPAHELEKAKVHLGKDYPHPIVDHEKARNEALAAYKKLK